MTFTIRGYQKDTAGMRSGDYPKEMIEETIHGCWATFQSGCEEQVSDAVCLLPSLHNLHVGRLFV